MEIASHWRLRKQRYILLGEGCACGQKLFPPRDKCPYCRRDLGRLDVDEVRIGEVEVNQSRVKLDR